MKKISKYYWIKLIILQIIIYLILYELTYTVVDFNLSKGITSLYLLFLFIILSIILGFITFLTKKSNLFYITVTFLLFMTISSLELLSSKRLLLLIGIISFTSFYGSYFINSFIKKKTN